jgi:DNA end-binding protein Ku
LDFEHSARTREIAPIYYERAYHLSPGKLGDEPYRLLHAALKRSQRIGIGRFVFHNKAHLVAIRALEDVIVLHTMRFSDELVPDRELDLPESQKEPSELELDTAQLLIDQLHSTFEPDSYDDTYRDAVLGLIERKARGEAIEAPEKEQVAREGDLLEALEASLEGHGGRRRRAKSGVARSSASPSASPSPSYPARGRGRGDR